MEHVLKSTFQGYMQFYCVIHWGLHIYLLLKPWEPEKAEADLLYPGGIFFT